MSSDCPLLSSKPTSNIQIANDQRNGHCINELEEQLNGIGKSPLGSYSPLKFSTLFKLNTARK